MLRFLRWLVVLIGGVLVGGGLVLHGQVAVARYMREEVDRTFFLWRAIGNATFAFQSDDVRMALVAAETPEEALRESDRAAWVLVIIGGLLALTGPLLHSHRHPGQPGAVPSATKPQTKVPARNAKR
ncbi:MAG: hypothetical protein H6838_03535 [Planctomycetes bacterium]|nr:hypothetical protein [Planctomycetota bacterium]MCB9884536.1 hypothetical protein [Planctomycetota bacterium]